MRLRMHWRHERVGIPRGRLIASVLLAALLPFLAAWWIADAYVKDEARVNQEVRLTFAARSAAREATAILAGTRARAIALAESPALQRAARRHDRKALEMLLRQGEAVHLSAGRPAWVGQRVRGAPAVSVVVTSGDHRLATVSVSAPAAGQTLLDRVATFRDLGQRQPAGTSQQRRCRCRPAAAERLDPRPRRPLALGRDLVPGPDGGAARIRPARQARRGDGHVVRRR